ncbi:MAG: HAD family phosphatase [Bacteroides sp.]|nr:HAD family phosphatase [Bacteroides sp.]MDD6149311.1 HAD family phosphatase [Bacteroides sp.]MDY2973433.1 HAD family phosphatase [Candidatus Cryptobacteroides sp.]MED9899338.1 HAD family phosphatase [Bacteroidales bacterium]
MIKNIIFDFGGVLLDWNPRYLYKSYFNNDEEMEHFLADICNGEWNIRQDAGRPFAEAVKELQAKFPEYAEAIQMYDDDWEKMLKCELPESIDLLKELKFMGYGIYGLTNWSAEKIGYAFANYSFFSLFDGIVVSGVEKVVKPDRKIYEILLERYSLKPGECVFIDDNQDNVDMAKVLGINAIRFDNIGNVKEHLETLLNKQL